MSRDDAVIVWFAGVRWDAMIGTDRRIVAEISEGRPVVWIDPADRRAWRGWMSGHAPAITAVGDLTRVVVPAPPGVSRWPSRGITRMLRELSYRRAVRGRDVRAVIVANPVTSFPRTSATKILYVTDDWVAGAPLMGFEPKWVSAVLDHNIMAADEFVVVSPPLARSIISRRPTASVTVLPNGAPAPPERGAARRIPTAGLIGQINERIDLSLLEAVADDGLALRIVGPRTSRDPSFNERFERLAARPTVDWRGAVGAHEVPAHLSEIAVGLTPYTPTAFNLASSPLKTLEYLAAGVPVVSSDLPASRWLDFADVVIASDAVAFAASAREAIGARHDQDAEARRMSFAGQHSWRRRADEIEALADAAHRRRERPREERM